MRPRHCLAAIVLALVPFGPARASSTQQNVDFVLDASNRPRIVAYDDLNFFVRLGIYDASAVWRCYFLQDAPLMGGTSTTAISGSDGAAVVDVGGTPYTAYTVQKVLNVEDPAHCGNVNAVDRVQLWLQKGTTVTTASQVCIDSTGSLYGCVNFSVVGIHVTLARTSDGRIHAAYQAGDLSLRYAVSNTSVTSFTPEFVGPGSSLPGGLSLAVGSDGQPHVVFIQSGQYLYGVRSVGGWSFTPLMVPAYPNGYAGRPMTNVSLKLDGSNLASIAFTVGDTVWYARETSAFAFASAEIVAGSGVQGYPSLARGNDGTIHVSYFGYAPGLELMYYVTRTGNGWGTPVTVAASGSGLGGFSNKRQVIALTSGSNQLPKIAYPETNPGGGAAIWLAESDGSGWITNLVMPCAPPPPPPGDGGGGGGGHSGDETDPVTVTRSPEEVGNVIAMSSAPVLRGGVKLEFQIVTLRASSLKLEILDIAGRSAGRTTQSLNFGNNDVHWNVGSLPAGIYLVRASLSNGLERKFRIAVIR